MALEVSIKKKFKGFDLEAEFNNDKDCMGILGASGCGKSMTLKCIAGIEKPDSGRIVLNGRVLFDSENKINLTPQKRKIGYLFQHFALFPTMTVEQNILCGIPKEKDKLSVVKEKLSQFHLEELGKRYPNQLSGGQQQRVALARMFANEPDMIMLDEPFSALDSFLKDILQQQLKEVIEVFGGETIIVSHNRDEIYKLCKELAVMSDGQMILKGDTKKLFKSPKRVEAARLTGCKNISAIKKIDQNKLYAIDWKIYLTTAEPIGDDINYVGIRAHDLEPVETQSGDNIIDVEYISSTEQPFEVQCLLRNAHEKESNVLWWKFPKKDKQSIENKEKLKYISIAADKLMLLK